MFLKESWRTDLEGNWFETYSKLSDFEPMLVEVQEVHKNLIMMEDLSDTYKFTFIPLSFS